MLMKVELVNIMVLDADTSSGRFSNAAVCALRISFLGKSYQEQISGQAFRSPISTDRICCHAG